MAGEQKISAVDPDEPTPASEPAEGHSWAFAGERPRLERGIAAAESQAFSVGSPWVGRTVAGLTLAGWTGFFIWAHGPAMSAAADPGMWASWISAWATPTLLIGVLWLILMRSSRRETNRFVGTSRLLADESARLEARLLTINRELSLAREFISAQARDLDAVGRIAVDRLSQHADRLQSLVVDNHAQVETIATVSAAALENMERLRGQLPVLTSAAKDLTNHFGNAGRTANASLGELIAGFNRLAAAGQASEKLVEALRSQFDRAMDSLAARSQAMTGQAELFGQLMIDQQADFDAQLRARAAALSSEITETRSRLDHEEGESIISLRSRLMALRDESGAIARALRDAESTALDNWREAVIRIDRDMRSASATAEAQDDGMIERLSAQLAGLDAQIARRQSAHAAHLAALASHSEAATTQLATIESRIAGIATASAAVEVGITRSLGVLGQRLSEGRELLDETDHTLTGVTTRSARLLELIQGAATLSREDLATAIAEGVARLGDLEEHALTLREVVIDTDRSGASLAAYLLLTQDRLSEATAAIAATHDAIDGKSRAHAAQLDELTQSVTQLDSQTIAAAERVQGELRGAIHQLETAAGAAIDHIESRGAVSVSALASQLGAESGAAIERAMRSQVAETAGKLEQAAAHAAGISREAAAQLREQLGKVNDLVGNLETRVDHARARAEERVDDDFARRVALITEALNSNAIDIAKALDTDVSDTAWSAYLRGDRGIFTRRAVRLLDPPEARGIAQLYQADRDFRDYVSHYIHDFEAMLRQLLSTRDGHALGVTLLSSDMGKLYVALAQAIERLRN